jgi:DMSO/TMAO reductase YedYZ molybdopterin-dependent catalytic subunit
MTPISRGFGGRRRDDVDQSRLPPGHYSSVASRSWRPGRRRARRWEEWTFSIQGAGDEARAWTWDEFTALPAEDVTVDIHCVTKWSKLDTR